MNYIDTSFAFLNDIPVSDSSYSDPEPEQSSEQQHPELPLVSVATEIKALGGDNASDLNAEDISDFSAAEQRIIELMEDGNWYPDQTIIYVSQQREGLRRLRNLRKRGWLVEIRRVPGCRAYEYRLTKP